MSKSITFNKLAICSLTTAAMVATGQGAFAHTRLQSPVIAEGVRNYNNEAIGHGCHNEVANDTSIPVMGTSVVFPDVTATVTSKPVGATAADPATPAGVVTDWVSGAGDGYSKKVYTHDLFAVEGQKFYIENKVGSNGVVTKVPHAVGYWTGGGSLPGVSYIGLIPFRTDAVFIKPESCANSVTFVVAIADVCEMSTISGFNDENVNLWTPAVGSNYDGAGLHGYNSPATLKVVRNTTGTPATLTTAAVAANPLPASCGAGLDITVTPTAEQINRDMPAIDENGVQLWPQP